MTPNEYDALAADYHWLLSDERLTGEPFVAAHGDLLEDLEPGATLLDCACGIGVQALALARHGCRVWGTDGSAGMIAQAGRRAREAGLDVPFSACRWEELPQRFPEPFDVAFCRGNAIGHCRDADEMLRSLRGIRGVLEDGGRLLLDSRNWETMWADQQRFHTFGVRAREGVRCIPLCVWTYPQRWGDPFLVEVVFLFEQNGLVTHRSYPVTYYPFRLDELLTRLEAAGFGGVETSYAEGEAGYTVTTRRR